MRRSHLVPLLVVWVIPVGVAVVLLALADLGVLAVSLLVIELGVGGAVFLAKRRPEERAAPSRRPWLVPTLMIGSLVVMAGVAIVAANAG